MGEIQNYVVYIVGPAFLTQTRVEPTQCAYGMMGYVMRNAIELFL